MPLTVGRDRESVGSMLPGLRRAARLAGRAALLSLAGALLPAWAQAATQVSSNWAGHVALRRDRGAFRSISGTWVVPAATCTPGHEAFSAIWVGLGGYAASSKGLEQIGTEQDCGSAGQASYAAWLEVLPAGPIAVHMRLTPGDTVTASATLGRGVATLRIRDLTSRAHYTTTRRVADVDASSADWIVEAPSTCSAGGSCTPLPLADIATVPFQAASATVGRVTAPAGSPGWRDVPLQLRQASLALAPLRSEAGVGPTRTVVSETPSPAAPPRGAFTVALSEQTTQLPAPAGPTLPGFGRS